MRPYTRRGLRSRHTSGPMPRRSATPGRNGSNSASALSTSFSSVSTPSGFFRSTPIERRPRFSTSSGRRARVAAGHRSGAVDADHVRAHVGEHECAPRAGADAGQLDDAQPGEGPAHQMPGAAPPAGAVRRLPIAVRLAGARTPGMCSLRSPIRPARPGRPAG